jgi:Xaa-Pro aminopeptidase
MKLKQFQKYLKEHNINLAFLVHPDSNITYFTQMKPSYAHLIITPRSAELNLTKLDKLSKLKDISVNNLKKDWDKKKNKNIKKIGINKATLTTAFHEKLKKIFPKAKLIDISKQLNLLRSQKTEVEIKKIDKACQITTDAFNQLINQFSPKRFKTELDVAFFLEKHMKEQNADLAFPTIVASSKNSAVPHHQTSTSRLRKGFLQLDFGACYQNYCADMSRVLHLGTIGNKEKKHFQLLLNSQTSTIKETSLNKRYKDLDKYSRKLLGKYSKYFIHSLGHGVGIDVHEQPSFTPMAKIEQNHVFTIEPGIYFPGKYGLRIEDTLTFNKRTKILTTAPKELSILK